MTDERQRQATVGRDDIGGLFALLGISGPAIRQRRVGPWATYPQIPEHLEDLENDVARKAGQETRSTCTTTSFPLHFKEECDAYHGMGRIPLIRVRYPAYFRAGPTDGFMRATLGTDRDYANNKCAGSTDGITVGKWNFGWYVSQFKGPNNCTHFPCKGEPKLVFVESADDRIGLDGKYSLRLPCPDCGLTLALLDYEDRRPTHFCEKGLPKPPKVYVKGSSLEILPGRHPYGATLTAIAYNEEGDVLDTEQKKLTFVDYCDKPRWSEDIWILNVNKETGRIGLDECFCGDCWRLD